MSFLNVTSIYKDHNSNFLLKDVSLEQQYSQKIAIAGETGSGKTTLMRIIAGLGQADQGTITFEGKQVKGIEEKLMPGHPGIAYLSQHFELSNNYRVEEILSYANKLTDDESVALYAMCRIDHLLLRKTNSLSGGEKQRVALARLLTLAPRLLLLDEPFSNMDLIHKTLLKIVIDDIGSRLGITCMLISHDPADMLPWADELLIMRQGEIVNRGGPRDLYSHPPDEYVAGLLGKYNKLLPDTAAALNADTSVRYLRPENIAIVPFGTGTDGQVVSVAYFGSHYELQVDVAGQSLTVSTDAGIYRKGDHVRLRIKSL
jgi:ABC-type Fe3+/spermidine/putrescine transport system ATPase subunit